jgi:hypothetical protein
MVAAPKGDALGAVSRDGVLARDSVMSSCCKAAKAGYARQRVALTRAPVERGRMGADPSDVSITDGWVHARLIPTAGIRNELERERRASSCLLAAMHGVPEFAHLGLLRSGGHRSSTGSTDPRDDQPAAFMGIARATEAAAVCR